MTDLAYILDGFFNGGTIPANLYIGLVSAENFTGYDRTNDTMSSHPGWEEFTDYSEATRRPWTPGNTIDGYPASVSNPSAATITPTANGASVGVFLTTNNTKGGTTGQLFGPWNNLDGVKILREGIPYKMGVQVKLRSNTAR